MGLPVNSLGLRETCYFCGCFLLGKNYSVHYRGEMRLVCRDCFNLYNNHDYAGLCAQTFHSFVCDGCGRTMPDSAYTPTISGSYCADCVSRSLESLRQLRIASELEG